MFSLVLTFVSTCRSRCHRKPPKRANGRAERISTVAVTAANGNSAVVHNIMGASQSRTIPIGAIHNCRTCNSQIVNQRSVYGCARQSTAMLDPVELLARRTPPPPYVCFIANYDLSLQQQQRADQNPTDQQFPPHPNSVSHQSLQQSPLITRAHDQAAGETQTQAEMGQAQTQAEMGQAQTQAEMVQTLTLAETNVPSSLSAAQSISPPPSYDEAVNGITNNSLVSPPPSYEISLTELDARTSQAEIIGQ